ncbi:efflux RND transporter periplasmic adaptor subunit [Coprobacter sp.]
MKKSILKNRIFLLAGVGLAVFSCTSKKAEQKMSVPEISVAYPVVKPIVLHKTYPGYLSSVNTVDLMARVNGYLQSTPFTAGSLVKKGQLLFVIEPTLYEDAVKRAEAGLKNAQASLDYAENNYVRMKEASRSDAISEIDLIKSATQLISAKSSVKDAEAQLETAKTNLGYCYVRAPFTGHISKSLYSVGSYISGEGQAAKLATIYQDDKMNAYFNIEDNQYLKMLASSAKKSIGERLPDEVEILFQSPLSRQYMGKLNYLSPNIDLATGTLNIRAEIENPDNELKDGLYVNIRLPYGKRDSAVLVKDASIGTDQLGKFLYIVNDSNKVFYQHIETGELVSDTLRLVTSGLRPDDRYVTKALLKVRDGMEIKPLVEKN